MLHDRIVILVQYVKDVMAGTLVLLHPLSLPILFGHRSLNRPSSEGPRYSPLPLRSHCLPPRKREQRIPRGV